jgi:hypothetical protein
MSKILQKSFILQRCTTNGMMGGIPILRLKQKNKQQMLTLEHKDGNALKHLTHAK